MVKTPDMIPILQPLTRTLQELNPLDEHHIKLRWVAGIVAILSLLRQVLEVYILHHFELWQGLGDFVVFLAIAPITVHHYYSYIHPDRIL